MTDPTITPPIEAVEQRSPEPSRFRLLPVAAVGYSLAWIVGLFLASSSTDVTPSGSAIVREGAPQVVALTLQFLLTEGVAALALLVVVIGLCSATGPGALRGTTLVVGAAAVTISLVQTVLGVCLVDIAVRDRNATLASSLTVALNELDGVKMALLAAMSFAVSVAQWRRKVRLPVWLLPTGIATGVTLVVSAIGYVIGSSALSVAAWVSLPLLLIYVIAVGLCARPGSQR